jgi:hypothetical protein
MMILFRVLSNSIGFRLLRISYRSKIRDKERIEGERRLVLVDVGWW